VISTRRLGSRLVTVTSIVIGLASVSLFPWTCAEPAAAGEIYSGTAWSVVTTSTDYAAPTLDVFLDGAPQGTAQRVQFHHSVPGGPGYPQVAVIDSPGYLRLKPARDPSPFGTSFIVGPAYWSDPGPTYHHNPTLTVMNIDTTRLNPSTGHGPLQLTMRGHNGSFETTYEAALMEPGSTLISMEVTQSWCATTTISIDGNRQAQHEGFRLAQFSSMFLDAATYHDSDSGCYQGSSGTDFESAFANENRLVFSAPDALGRPWVKVRHSDESGWQGATPSTLICLSDSGRLPRTTPQGWITQSADFNDDNVGLWINDDGAPGTWASQDTTSVAYSLRSALDNTAPVVSVATPCFSTYTSAGLSFPVSWSGADPSGMSAYTVRSRPDTTVAPTAWRGWTADSRDSFLGGPGHTYYFSARGEDRAANTSGWSPIRSTTVPYDQTAFLFRGAWGTCRAAALYLGTARYASTRGVSATRVVPKGCTRVVLMATKRRDAGRAAVSLNGSIAGVVDLYSRNTAYRRAVWSRWLNPAAAHRVTILVLGSRRKVSQIGRAHV